MVGIMPGRGGGACTKLCKRFFSINYTLYIFYCNKYNVLIVTLKRI